MAYDSHPTPPGFNAARLFGAAGQTRPTVLGQIVKVPQPGNTAQALKAYNRKVRVKRRIVL